VAKIILRLPILRAERRLSQRQLAARAGLRPDTVSAMERGDTNSIRFDTLARICEVLNCEPGDLFEIEEDFHKVPVLGGEDEDDIIRQRLADPGRRVDGPTFIAELLQLAEGKSIERRKAAS
jgi:putative transcriptional regulator